MLQVFDLWQVVIDDVGVGRVQRQEILVILLGRVEAGIVGDLGDDRLFEDMRLVELGDIGFGDLALFRVGDEKCRAVLGAFVRSLEIELRRVVRDREEDLQELAVADLLSDRRSP